MKRFILISFFSAVVFCGFAAQISEGKANPSDIRIVPVRPTPEPDNVESTIQFPKSGQVLYSNPVEVQIRLDGFPLGTNSDFDRARQIYNDPNGQSMLVFVDNDHPIEIYQSFVDSLDNNNNFFNLTLNTQIPYFLSEGKHIIRAFPARSYGEGLKDPGCFAATSFYIGSMEDNLGEDLSMPYLTYNEPLETLRYNEKQPLLLDFYVTNIQLSTDGFKVLLTIDDTVKRTLTRWVPFYIYGLKRGTHTIRLQLINEKNEVAPGIFNDVVRTISIH